ncbi:F0F1 ATP synthase subunit B [Methylocystis sp. MJC1]|jgi:F-type H+-transporting ATPase subunit b|uniref:F0F1 ATP synthase subunit B family protein n=1 Tax=Methylocystis sp. MJC1 TaxID=2654282 RepID=UPI0013E9ED70|nr:F0F1 ATP synthase subunit B [Methylocystis sp. MJC1]KAF2989892.1 ATP synthase subunit b [Methylocystis sp. MJC1]MBU6528339.1 F0F1 ATP synthase subunit B [Methylocystis sp. MJC1]UZX11244.1 F0F1 ATP synthase subunit B [Methylocystis sp. MJC1]
MRIDWWTLSLQTINALVLIWLLAYFLFKPIANVIAERKATAARLLDEAEQAKSAAEAARDEEKAALADLAERRSAALAAAEKETEARKEALLAAARVDADHLRADARAEAARDAAFSRKAQMKHAGALAIDIAKRALERLPPSSLVSGFIEGLARTATQLPPEAKLDFEEGDARLKAPRALTPQEEADCRRALETAFGRPIDFSVESDPSLIAGLELENRHTSVRNSLSADLARIAASLDSDDAK